MPCVIEWEGSLGLPAWLSSWLRDGSGQPARHPGVSRDGTRLADRPAAAGRPSRHAPDRAIIAGVPPIYVTGHRNPDTDSIASAIGYAELKSRLDPRNDYVAVRLGDCNAQTRWLLERSGAPEPVFLPHVMPRARDVMQTDFPSPDRMHRCARPGWRWARPTSSWCRSSTSDGALTGVLTERALARRYIRESRRTSTLEEAPTYVSAVVSVLEGAL